MSYQLDGEGGACVGEFLSLTGPCTCSLLLFLPPRQRFCLQCLYGGLCLLQLLLQGAHVLGGSSGLGGCSVGCCCRARMQSLHMCRKPTRFFRIRTHARRLEPTKALAVEAIG
jgi:hypothetical protein